MDPIQQRQGAYLPHWTRTGSIYSVTFRLADSLPQSKLKQWRTELEILSRKRQRTNGVLPKGEQQRLAQLHSSRTQQFLDSGVGSCWLRQPPAANIVRDSLAHFHAQRYWIHAWCIMPNHVHVVVRPAEEFSLPKIVQGWKSFSARLIAQSLPIVKPLWHAEYYDHLIRDAAEYAHAVEYVLSNPTKAQLKNWTWVGETFPVSKLALKEDA